jgi:hypothetical protein
MDDVAPILGGVKMRWRYRWKSCPAFVGPAVMAPVGDVHLLGGIAECVIISLAFLELAVFSGWKPRFGVGSTWWRRPQRRPSVGSIMFEGTGLEVLRYTPMVLPMFKIELQQHNARRRRWLQDGTLLRLFKSYHPLPTIGWRVHRQVKFSGSCCFSEVTNVSRGAEMLF